jgi:two-component system, LytTR family, sensor kinase
MTITKIRRIELYVVTVFAVLVFCLDFQNNYQNVIQVLSKISVQEEIRIGTMFDLWQNIFFPLLSIYVAVLGCWLLVHYYTIPQWFANKNLLKTIALLLLGFGILVLGVYLYLEFYKILRFRYDYKQAEDLRTVIGAKVMPVFRIKHWIETTATVAFIIAVYEVLAQFFYKYFEQIKTSDDARTKVYYETAALTWIYFCYLIAKNLIDNTESSYFNFVYGLPNFQINVFVIFDLVRFLLIIVLHSWAYHLIFFKDKNEREFKTWVKIALIGLTAQCALRIVKSESYSDWPVDLFIIPIVALATAAARYIYARPKIITDRLTKKLTQNQAELSSLKAQINPHFLFNAMNTLYATAIEERAEQTTKGIHQLSEMMRFMMNENNQDQIDIQSEVQYLRNYIDLQRLRFVESDKFELKVELDDTLCLHSIAPMLLVPFVENAFKHGISLRRESWIYVKLHCQHQRLHFSVFNSVHPKQDQDPEKYSSGIGLVNVKKRLDLLYAKMHSLTIHRTEKEFSVVLEIDFTSKQSNIGSALDFYKN